MAEIEVVLSQITAEDLDLGTGTVDVPTSDGGTRQGNKINAASIPLKVAGAADSDLTSTNVDDALAEIMGAVDALAADTYSADEVDGLLDGKSNTGHGHAIADVSGLQGALDGKAPSAHNHPLSDVTGLSDALAAKADKADTYTKGEVTGLIDSLAAASLSEDNVFSGERNTFRGLRAESVRVTRLPLMDPDTHEFEYGAGYPPVLSRTGPATYLSTTGTLTTAGDGVARIGVPGPVARRNLLLSSAKMTAFSSDLSVTLAYEEIDEHSAALKVTGGSNSYGRAKATVNLSGSSTYTITGIVKPSSTGRAAIALDSNVSRLSGLTPDVWQPFSVTISGGTYLFLYPDTDGSVNPSDYAFFKEVQIDAGSTATPYQPTNATGVDLTHPLNGAGLVLEGSGTNLVTYSEDFSAWNKTRSTVTTNATTAPDGTATADKWLDSTDNNSHKLYAMTSGSSITTYTVSIFAKAAELSNFQLALANTVETGRASAIFNLSAGTATGDGKISAVGNGWYRCSITGVLQSGDAGAAIFMYLIDGTSVFAGTGTRGIYVWGAQIEQSPFATSYIPTTTAAITRQPDLVGIVPPHNLLKWSEDFSASSWVYQFGGAVVPKQTAPDGTLADKISATGTGSHVNNYVGLPTSSLAPASPGEVFTLAVNAAVASTGKMKLVISFRDAANAFLAGSQVTHSLTNAFATYILTSAAAPAGTKYVGIQVFPGDNAAAWQDTFIKRAWQVKGSHPGPYVRTTDTPIPAPVSPALDPAWQQNGRVSFRVLPPPISTGKNYHLIGSENLDTVLDGQFRLFRHSSYTGNNLGYDRKHNGATGSASKAGRGLLNTSSVYIWDGTPHDFELEWTNEINEATGVREMWQRLYIDGVLVAQQDVAALYGATAWAEIDPSRLVSDGNVFSTLSSLELQYPVHRPGYWLP